MLPITIPEQDLFDPRTEKFIVIEETKLKLEHSLVSLSKWESKFSKPFLTTTEKSGEEVLGYVEVMVLDEDFDATVLNGLTQKNMDEINAYITSEQSATTFFETPQDKAKGRNEVITAELIYFWMVSYNIPFHPAETWHLNRLFNLLKIANLKNGKQKKMSKSEIIARNRALNEQRKAALNTTG